MATNIFQDWQGLQTKFDTPTDGSTFSIAVANRVWDPGTMAWVSQTASGGGGGGSVTQGTTPWVMDGQKYATQLDASATPVYYIGQAAVGSSTGSSVWRIYKLDATGGSIAVTWAGGAATFVNVWTNRTSLSYS
jgi:hypothetical protein